MALEQTLKADPKLAEDFGHAIDVVKAGVTWRTFTCRT